ncbi:MAG: hypothetical protein IH626_22620 [Rhodospirillales bacterium]|nr:hypothetical protein [Rhodospirillales bacterium]
MGRRLFQASISSYGEYRRRLGRLADLWGADPTLDSPEAESLLDDIAAYMVDGGELGGDEMGEGAPRPAAEDARLRARRPH